MGLVDRAPAPTPVHGAELAEHLLGKRQDDTDSRTCGYDYADLAGAIICPAGYACATNSMFNGRSCCPLPVENCYIYSSCVASTDLSSCNNSCRSDLNVAKCTNPVYDQCYTRFFTTGDRTTETAIGCWTARTIVYAALTYTTDSGLYPSIPGESPPIPSQPTSPSTDSSAGTGEASNSNTSEGGGGGGGGLSEGAIIGIAVCATVVGLALIGLAIFLLWRRKKKNEPPRQQYHNPNNPPMMQSPPPDISADFPHNGDAFHPNNFESFNHNFSQMDDDEVAKARRFSNDGTIDQTVAARTNDEYRPQAA